MKPRILVLDIETSPIIADVWTLWPERVSINQVREWTRMISVAAKWTDSRMVMFKSEFHDGREEMVKWIHGLVDEADVVVHHNGTTFDMPHLRREFLVAGLNPPSPVLEIDTLRIAKARFKFGSNKLDALAQYLGVGAKVKHTGHQLWVACMAGDEKAWAQMRAYNKGDVLITQYVYEKLKPWAKTMPNFALFGGGAFACPSCQSANTQRRGYAHTTAGVYQRRQCQDCGVWSREKKSIQVSDLAVVA